MKIPSHRVVVCVYHHRDISMLRLLASGMLLPRDSSERAKNANGESVFDDLVIIDYIFGYYQHSIVSWHAGSLV